MRRGGLLLALALLAHPALATEFTTLKGHGGPIMGLARAPDGRIASASFDNALGLWEGRTPHWLEGHDAAVTALAFAPDGTLYSGGDDFALRVWGEEPRELGRHKGKITSIAVSGDRLASGSWDGSIRLWDGDGSFEELSSPGAGVNALAFAGETILLAATSKGVLWRYDLAKGAEAAPLPLVRHGFGINKLAVGEGWVAYGAVDGGTRVIALDTGEAIADFTLDRRPVLALAHHAPTGQIAVGDGHGYIMMIDTGEWRITRDYRATRRGPVWALAFSADGSVIHAGGLDDAIYAWPVAALDAFDPAIDGERSFLRDADSMPNGERQFMRKCSICHTLDPGPSRKAGPSLYGVFGRAAGDVAGYRYSSTLEKSDIVWSEQTIDALFELGPDHYIPGSKMPMQVIARPEDRDDLITFLRRATRKESE